MARPERIEMTVIDLAQAKKDREPHMTGPAMCLSCQHEWTAVAPLGVLWLECPACSLMRGRFIANVERDDAHWECNCGNRLFYITPRGAYCPNCGLWQDG